ncbi:MAG: MerR family transcriptional regulator [Bacillus subtilis]|nr:MerR family transcriptional regulator [Bacillus subtilis]
MDKIGIIAARSGLSVRTLRYWEQVGILKSIRGENGYRYYDKESLTRIERIALLKRWEIPLIRHRTHARGTTIPRRRSRRLRRTV